MWIGIRIRKCSVFMARARVKIQIRLWIVGEMDLSRWSGLLIMTRPLHVSPRWHVQFLIVVTAVWGWPFISWMWRIPFFTTIFRRIPILSHPQPCSSFSGCLSFSSCYLLSQAGSCLVWEVQCCSYCWFLLEPPYDHAMFIHLSSWPDHFTHHVDDMIITMIDPAYIHSVKATL